MSLSTEQSARLLQIRGIIIEGKAPPEERKALAMEGVMLMRQDRVSASAASGRAKTTAAAARAVPDTGSILAQMKANAAKLKTGLIDAAGNPT